MSLPDDVADELKRQVESKGVGTIQVSDGRIFMFSREFLEGMIQKMGDEEHENLILFVAQEGVLPKTN